MDELFRAQFPNLTNVGKKKTSNADEGYNCIAWAFKDSTRWWWPSEYTYWPTQFSGMTTLEAFQSWFQQDGWEPAANAEPEPGFEKVALFAKGGVPTHAARLLATGLWTSKLGKEIDISHDLNELDGPAYGSVLSIYRKQT